MMLLRSRHLELDKFRKLDHGFNHAWLMFFGTIPPGINAAGVFFTEAEREALTDEVPAFAAQNFTREVEQYDPYLHNGKRIQKERLAALHGSGVSEA